MNTRQLQYALKLSQTLNFSQVAEQLNISQPALSKQIISLENELGIKLFDRTTNPMKLTPAGEHFIQEAKEILYKEDQLLKSMENYKTEKSGRLVIGVSPFRSLYMIPPIVKEIRKNFPGIQIFLRETNSDTLRKESSEGHYDFAIINLPVDESLVDIIPLEPDTLVLAVPNKMLPLLPDIPATSSDKLPVINLSDCKDLPFIVVGQGQEMRHLFDRLCVLAGFHPNITMEVVGVTTAWAMAHTGIGATLLPLQFINNESFDDNITVFKIENDFIRQPAIVTKRGQYLSEYAKYAIESLTSLFK